MASSIDLSSTSRRMSRVAQLDTAPELNLRKALWKAGLRYRLHAKYLPGRPDVVFPKARVAVFIHGCFWHMHGCRRTNMMPKRNAPYWAAKLERNVERDRRAVEALRALGWLPVIVWECATTDQGVADVEAALATRAQ